MNNDYVIVCGDFGYIFTGSRRENAFLDKLEKLRFTILFVDGNHENFDEIVVYYSTTKDSTAREESYAKCVPIIIKGYTEDIVRYVNTIML